MSAQRALLGNVGPSVVGVAVASPEPGVLTLTGFLDLAAPDHERESLDVALTEMVADFPEVHAAEFRVVEVSDGRIPRDTDHLWVFARYGA